MGVGRTPFLFGNRVHVKSEAVHCLCESLSVGGGVVWPRWHKRYRSEAACGTKISRKQPREPSNLRHLHSKQQHKTRLGDNGPWVGFEMEAERTVGLHLHKSPPPISPPPPALPSRGSNGSWGGRSPCACLSPSPPLGRSVHRTSHGTFNRSDITAIVYKKPHCPRGLERDLAVDSLFLHSSLLPNHTHRFFARSLFSLGPDT